MPIQLIVGLGNPGREYVNTRHNAGFWWVERCAADLSCVLKMDAKYAGLVGEVSMGHTVRLLMPQTFMNASGKSVGTLVRFFNIPPENILVVHDELDLSPGMVRLKQGGGHGGHNGLKDIIAQLGDANFWRLRVGVGHPGHRDGVVDWVLSPPNSHEADLIGAALDTSLRQLPQLLRGEFSFVMQTLHTVA